MFITEKIPAKFNQSDQITILTDATWEDYEQLSSPDFDNYLISYFKNQITIMSPGRNHERIAELIGDIVAIYCYTFGISYYGFGSTRLKKEGLVGKEPDKAYAFGEDKDKPDLAIEVNFTSGSIDDLIKYKYLQIKEVWVWQNQELKFYLLKQDRSEYIETEKSFHLNKIQASVLVEFINRGLREDFLKIQKEFIQGIGS